MRRLALAGLAMMQRLLPVLLAALCLALPASASARHTRRQPPAKPESTLVYNDEFNGRAGSWPAGWDGEEGAANDIEENGKGELAITDRREGSGYTYASIETQGHFSTTYGRIEAAIAFPEGQGIWPALWMLGTNYNEVGWPACGEIDIMEAIDPTSTTTIYGTLHGPSKSSESAEVQTSGSVSNPTAFHDYGVEWSENRVTFTIEGKSYATFTPLSLPLGMSWVYNHAFFLKLDLAVGGEWPGPPNASTPSSPTMLIKWVRAWTP